MGATRNTGYLQGIILYDSSNNVGISTAVDPSYKVTLGGSLSGTAAVFSSSVTSTAFVPTGSTIPTNGMYLSAANTLNFATNSANRLSISTSTITSTLALSGTSATFNFVRSINETGFLLRNDANSANLGGLTRRSYWAGGTAADTQIFAETGYAIYLNPGGSSSIGLTLASTGAATFSSSISATSATFSSSVLINGTFEAGRTGGAVTRGDLSVDTTSTAAKVIIGRLSSTGSDNTTLVGQNRVGVQGWSIDSFGVASFGSTLAVTGAATFSSSVTAGGINTFLSGGLNNTTYALNASISSSASASSVAPVARFSNNGGGYVTKIMFSDNNRGDAYITHVAGSAFTPSTRWLGFGVDAVDQMIINASGNVGIGTSTPGATLVVGTQSSGSSGASYAADNSIIARVGAAYSANRVVGLTIANTAAAAVNNEATLSFIVANNYSATGLISSILTNSTTAATDMTFFTYSGGLTERMRIISTGYTKHSNDGTYIGSTGTYHEFTGTTAASDTLSLRHKAASQPFGQSITFSAATPNNLDQYFLYCQDSTNVKAIIWSNGTFNSRTNTYTSVSDINLKQDIIDASSQWNDIKNLTVRKFRLKDEVAADPNYPYHIGVVAQELELISPNLVDNIPNYKFIDGEKVVDGHIKTVKYSILYMKAIKALQEAMERIEKLEAKLN